MPYARRKPIYRRRIYRRKTSNKRIEKVVKKVYQREQKKTVEPKYYDQVLNTAITTTPQVNNLSIYDITPDGATEVKHTVKNLSLQIAGSVSNGTSGDDIEVRMCLVRVKKSLDRTGNQPTWTDVFETNTLHSFPKQTTKEYFDIMRDWKFVLTGGTEGVGNVKQIKYYKKLNQITKFFNSSNDDVEKNGYVLMMRSTLATSSIGPNLNVRLTYINQ